MSKPRFWKVRVLRSEEAWVQVLALTPDEAEAQARGIPGVQAVFKRSATPADKPAVAVMPLNVDEGDGA